MVPLAPPPWVIEILPPPALVIEPPLRLSVPWPPSRPTASQLLLVTVPALKSNWPVPDPDWAIQSSLLILSEPPVWLKYPLPPSPTMKLPFPVLLIAPAEKLMTPCPPRPMDIQLLKLITAVPLTLLVPSLPTFSARQC